MTHANHLPEGYTFHKEWELRTFTPHRYGRENNSFVSIIILFPILILLLPKVFMLSESENAVDLYGLLWMFLLSFAVWYLCKILSRLLSGHWNRIYGAGFWIFPGWRGAVSKKVVNRCCVVAPLLTIGICLIAFYVISPLFIMPIVFMTSMLVVGINISFKLIEEPNHVLVAMEDTMLRVYVPSNWQTKGSVVRF